MTREQMEEIARGNVERNLGDEDDLYDDAYVLGFDALVDRGVDPETAREVAAEVAQRYAQP